MAIPAPFTTPVHCVRLSDLKPGNAFEHESGYIYLVTEQEHRRDDKYRDYVDAVCLMNGARALFAGSAPFRPCKLAAFDGDTFASQ